MPLAFTKARIRWGDGSLNSAEVPILAFKLWYGGTRRPKRATPRVAVDPTGTAMPCPYNEIGIFLAKAGGRRDTASPCPFDDGTSHTSRKSLNSQGMFDEFRGEMLAKTQFAISTYRSLRQGEIPKPDR